MDLVEDFRATRHELFVAAGAKSPIHGFISNPRFSTFRQLSPTAASFHHAQQPSEKSAADRTLVLPGMAHFANIKAQKARQRVTVRFERGTPSLHMRFSTLDVPSPTDAADEVKSRPLSESEQDALSLPQPSFRQPTFRDSADSIPSFVGPFELVTAPRRMLSQRSAKALVFQAQSPTKRDPTTVVEPQDLERVQSVRGITDSLQAVQDLAGQFPGPPITSSIPQVFGSPSELLFKEPPVRKGYIVVSDDSAWSSHRFSSVPFSDNSDIRSRGQPSTMTGTHHKSARVYTEQPIDPFSDDEEEDTPSYSGRASADSKKTSSATTVLGSYEAGAETPANIRSHERDIMDIDHLAIPPLKSATIEEEDRRLGKAMSKDISSSKAPRPRHPTPQSGGSKRRSLKHIIIPPRGGDMPEIMDEPEDDTVDYN